MSLSRLHQEWEAAMGSDCSSSLTFDDSPSLTEAEKAVLDVIKDDLFYFSLVTFKVDNCLFRVPKHEFEEQSQVFRDMFSMPPVKGSGGIEGTSDNNPIHLETVSKDEFKLFLKILYPPNAENISSTLTFEQCTSLLKLSHMWDFQRINHIAKTRIRYVLWDKIPTVEKVKLAHDYQVEEWYAPAYHELAIREEPLSVEEAQRLGLEFSITMAQVRQAIRPCIVVKRSATDAISKFFFNVINPST